MTVRGSGDFFVPEFGPQTPKYQLNKDFRVTEAGIHVLDKTKKQAFKEKCWQPYLEKLQRVQDEVKRKTDQGYPISERMPPQATMLELQEECRALTEAWNGEGKGEYSAFYNFFITISEISKDALFTVDEITDQGSVENGLIKYISREERAVLASGIKPRVQTMKTFGERAAREGRSGIDNTIISNVFTKRESFRRSLHNKINRQAVAVYKDQQINVLKAAGLSEDSSPEEIKRVLSQVETQQQLSESGLSTSSYSFKMLVSTGQLIESWGQLPDSVKEENAKTAEELADQHYGLWRGIKLTQRMKEAAEGVSSEEVKKSFEEEEKFWEGFVSYIENNPGRFFLDYKADDQSINHFLRFFGGKEFAERDLKDKVSEADKKTYQTLLDKFLNKFLREVVGGEFKDRTDDAEVSPELRDKYRKNVHKLFVITGMFQGFIKVEPRRKVEQEAPHRHFELAWSRCGDLTSHSSSEGETVFRKRGTKEVTGIRANGMPYLEKHGLGIPVTSFREALPVVHTMGYNVNFPLDEEACLQNWFLIDIEKILKEYTLLNSPLPEAERLEGEESVDTAQNPKIGSSIEKTQHSQYSRASIKDYPLYQRRNDPKFFPKLNATVDLVPVGEDPDACFLKIVAENPSSEEIIQFLLELKNKFLEKAGGPLNVDFNVKCIDNLDGTATIIFAPIAQVKKVAKPERELTEEESVRYGYGIAVTQNPLTGEFNVDHEVPVDGIDSAKGAGIFVIKTKIPKIKSWIGKETLSRLYDFSRYPGALSILKESIS